MRYPLLAGPGNFRDIDGYPAAPQRDRPGRARPFSRRYPLVDGQGNFGNIDGYPAAAQRYTECRLARMASELLRDIDADTVDFGPNYDESRKEPPSLPSRFPTPLVNGAPGAWSVGRVRT